MAMIDSHSKKTLVFRKMKAMSDRLQAVLVSRGVSCCREEVLESMPPFMGGGEMIESVGLHESTYAPPPSRFEPGTPGIAEGIGFGSAVEYISNIGMDKIHAYEKELGGLLYQEASIEICLNRPLTITLACILLHHALGSLRSVLHNREAICSSLT